MCNFILKTIDCKNKILSLKSVALHNYVQGDVLPSLRFILSSSWCPSPHLPAEILPESFKTASDPAYLLNSDQAQTSLTKWK